MNRKRVLFAGLLTLLLLLWTQSIKAQYLEPAQQKPPLRERMFFGGNFGMQFGTYTYIEVSPIVGIWLLPRIGVAAGPTYKFLKDRVGSTSVYGGKAFTRLVLIQDINNIVPIGMGLSIYLHGEYEYLSYRSDFFYTNPETTRVGNRAFLVGFGISQHLGPRASMNLSLLWVINDPELDIYDNPEIRVGITF